jgi:hypothetical protein
MKKTAILLTIRNYFHCNTFPLSGSALCKFPSLLLHIYLSLSVLACLAPSSCLITYKYAAEVLSRIEISNFYRNVLFEINSREKLYEKEEINVHSLYSFDFRFKHFFFFF